MRLRAPLSGSLQLAFRKISHDVFILLEVSKRSIDDETGKASFPSIRYYTHHMIRYSVRSKLRLSCLQVLTYFHLDFSNVTIQK